MKKSLPDISALPVRIGIRLLALEYLAHAESAQQRMAQDRDPEALHDFRVALRRLRSCLRIYRPYFEDTVRGKHRRAVRDVAAATGAARDLEVQLAWLEREREFEPDTATGARVLMERLQRAKAVADREALDAGDRFPALKEKLGPRLSRYSDEIDRRNPVRTLTCAEAAAQLTGPPLDELDEALAAARSVEDSAAIHQARIAGKRARYLLEPYRDAAPGGAALIKRFRRLQDSLGDLHDLDVMLDLTRAEVRVPHPGDTSAVRGLEALEAHLEDQRKAAYRKVKSSWLGSRGRDLVDKARAFAASLGAAPTARADVEIERKYLLRSMPRIPEDAALLKIDQGYLPGERLVERVRRVRTPEGTRYYRTVKLGTGVRRTEVEEETDEKTFRALWRLTKGRRLSKLRYVVRDGDHKWEIDRFTGRKLVLAEVELPDEAATVRFPEWLGRRIAREVTGEAKYLNVNLVG